MIKKINKFNLHTKCVTMVLFAVLSLALAGCAKKDSKTKITIKGSDTMVQLMSSWAEEYKKKEPGTDISVTGGGSGTGIAALLNGTADICSASRPMQEKEIKQAEQNKISPKEYTVASDGLAVFVNKDNPVNELTIEQVKKIYTGAYRNWKEAGGPDQTITALSRENSSGTYVFFQEHVLNKQDYAKEVRLMTSTSAIVQSVGNEKWSIGYGGIAYASAGNVKMISIKKDDNSPAVAPSEKTVLDGTYPISRPLFLYFNGEPQGNLRSFLDFCLSPDGQKITTRIGYIKVK